jgi:hypothetical protein
MSSIKHLDIVSDLHIDQWNSSYMNQFPCGKISHYPYKINSQSNMLVVAGDVSDDLNLTMNYLDNLLSMYRYILFVDGNHEHVHRYPDLYTHDEINNKVEELNDHNKNTKHKGELIYLTKNNFKIGNTAFIGCCGWWDYGKEKNKYKYDNYFSKWRPDFSKEQNKEFIKNVIARSKEEYEIIKHKLALYKDDESVSQIVLVTHTIPHERYTSEKSADTLVNNLLSEMVIYGDKNKIAYWMFGHTHDHYENENKHKNKENNIHFVCNPRGRPEDYNRKYYNLKTISLVKSKL